MKQTGHLVSSRVRENAVKLAFKSHDGERITLSDSYQPYFYVIAKKRESVEEISAALSQHPFVENTAIEVKFPNPNSKHPEQVVKATVSGVSKYFRVVKDAGKITGVKEFAEVKTPHWFKHASSRGLNFLAEYEIGSQNGKLEKSTQTICGQIPQLRLAAVQPASGAFAVIVDGQVIECNGNELAETIENSNVDVVFTSGGDGFLRSLPGMTANGEGCFFNSCQHVDLERDVQADIYLDANPGLLGQGLCGLLEFGRERLHRLAELSSVTGISFETASRVTPGKLNTFLHYREAKRRWFLIPDGKKLVEKPKTLRELEGTDKGGTIIYPRPGLYRNVAKCDFSSMYPSLIANFNISPDALDCTCCGEEAVVPNSPYSLCRKKQGIIPAGIEKVLGRRLELKRMMKAENDLEKKRELDIRQKALKNILVTCFGYLGYNAFVFSNVECKELVMLEGRRVLAQAKQIAERMGLNVIYGIVDSLFVQGEGPGQYGEFARAVTQETGIPLELECVFDAIAFPASDEGAGIANKYYGITEKGEVEARGIALRHSDACGLVKKFELEAIPILLGKGSLDERLEKAEEMVRHYATQIGDKQFPLEDYVIVKPLRKRIGEYVANAPHVAAFRQAPNGEGVSAFAYSVHGPAPAAKTSIDEIDAGRYGQLVRRALEELANGMDGD